MRTSFGLCLLAWMLAGFVGCNKGSTASKPEAGNGAPAASKPSPTGNVPTANLAAQQESPQVSPAPTQRGYLVAHVFVCLCDNRNQGTARVSDELGNGQDPSHNLYWGAANGVKTYFRHSSSWQALPFGHSSNDAILDQAAYVSTFQGKPLYVLAQAYDGAKGDRCLQDFFSAAAGTLKADLEAGEGSDYRKIPAGGQADIVCFVGHNLLMDISMPALPTPEPSQGPRYSVVLACKSNAYFRQALQDKLHCTPLVLTAGLMAPEAYTLEAVLMAADQGSSAADVREKAALAYQKHQRCTLPAARRLFVGS